MLPWIVDGCGLWCGRGMVGFHLTLYVFGLGMVSWGMVAEVAAGLGLGQQ